MDIKEKAEYMSMGWAFCDDIQDTAREVLSFLQKDKLYQHHPDIKQITSWVEIKYQEIIDFNNKYNII